MELVPEWPTVPFRVKELYGDHTERFDKHLAELEAVVIAHPNDPTVLFLLGYYRWFLGDKVDAGRLFRRAADRAEDDAVIERFLLEAEGRKASAEIRNAECGLPSKLN